MGAESHRSSSNQKVVKNNRILVVDDDPKVVRFYLDVLQPDSFNLSALEDFGRSPVEDEPDEFIISTAEQGSEGLKLVEEAVEQGQPFAMVFIDVRMPPGWDGLETAQRIREIDDSVYIVFISAYSDYSTDAIHQAMGKNTLMLDKPFRADIMKQMARSCCASWMREQHLIETREQLSRLSEQLAEQATHDGLTQIYNRHYLDIQIVTEMGRSRRENQPLGLLMVDVDWFKIYNDQHGHLVGDEALKQIAHTIDKQLHRPADFVARYGGEEFCVVLPNTDTPGVVQVAEQVRGAIETLQLPFVESSETATPWLTVSIGGVSRIPVSTDNDHLLIDQADKLLYQVKAEGKNRVQIEQAV